MAKKNKRAGHNASILFADEAESAAVSGRRLKRQASGNQTQNILDEKQDENQNEKQDENQKSFWSGLGRGERIGAITVCLLLVMGALGAGAGDKILSVFSSKNSQRNAAQSSPAAQTNDSYLFRLNPFVEPPSPTPTPQLSKEYIYAGSRMLAVEDANASALPPADLAVWRPSTGYWYVLGGQGSQQTAFQWGGLGDKPVPGDFDGDGKTDFSVFRPSTGYWYVSYSSNANTSTQVYFGSSSDVTAQADYDGDGKTDVAVFRADTTAHTATWYIQKSSDPNQGLTSQQFGLDTDVPTPADFDGDGKADLAVWRDGSATFYILRSSDSSVQSIAFGHAGDTPEVGDFDGDGKADACVWRPSGATDNQGHDQSYQWQIRYSSDNSYHAYTQGDPNSDIAVQNDYDGDGKVDVAFWRPSNGTWYIQKSSGGNRTEAWGGIINGVPDVPVPAFYRR